MSLSLSCKICESPSDQIFDHFCCLELLVSTPKSYVYMHVNDTTPGNAKGGGALLSQVEIQSQ